ncbi:MarR family transcriptional regulator [Bosea sp. ANAM02]|uniref:MarR family winged helix-turn-helix transcriptional regulator n=1 Tax=Bosea sp. ANAM02 TaxID=2020412 RepID=UPI001564E5BD|nr:MarR family transcriptional regulator [Bosea sp. ANAM02]
MQQSTSITKAVRLVRELRQLTPEMSLLEAHVLLTVARHPGINQSAVCVETGLSKSCISRHVDSLGERKGRGLVRASTMLQDRRLSELHLTAAGKAFVEEITGFL